jgi:catechol 2,3-dioxygenase-like lactoylglutathione lyase family enzyme
MRLKMCSIHVKDPAAAHVFYTETLGFETLMAMPEYNLFIIKDPGADNSTFARVFCWNPATTRSAPTT